MRMRRSPQSGFSFFEVVVVLFITGIILFCVGGLTRQTFKTLRFIQEKSNTIESATLACQRLATEMHEMIGAPTLAGSSILFRKIRPQAPLGLGIDPQTERDPDAWPRVYSQTSTVRYYQPTPDRVLRQVGSEPAVEVATDVNDFEITPLPALGNYTIVLTIEEDRRLVTFETVVNCPGVPR